MNTAKENLRYLTDVFSGADGGVTYVIMMRLFDQFDKDNEPRIIKLIDDFTKIVKYAENKKND